MADSPRFFLTTAIDYPNSRPHIGTAFEKLGADVQARYRRMEGYDGVLPHGQRREHRQGGQARRRAGPRSEGLLRRHGPAIPGSLARPRHQLRRFHPDQRASATTRAAGSSSRRSTTTATSTRASTRAGTARAARRSRPTKRSRRPAASAPSTRRRLSGAASRATSSRCRSSRIGCSSSTSESRTSFSRKVAATRSSTSSRPGCRTSTSRGPASRGASACRSTRRSPFTSGSTPCSTTSPASATAPTMSVSLAGGRPTCTSSARTSRASTAPCGRPCCCAAGIEAAAARLRPRLRLHQGRGDRRRAEDQQIARQRRRADGDHHEVQRGGVPLLLPARVPLPRRRRVQLEAVRGGVQLRPGEQPRQHSTAG